MKAAVLVKFGNIENAFDTQSNNGCSKLKIQKKILNGLINFFIEEL